jgi:hypothetical protein
MLTDTSGIPYIVTEQYASNTDNYSNIRHESSHTIRNKGREYLDQEIILKETKNLWVLDFIS